MVEVKEGQRMPVFISALVFNSLHKVLDIYATIKLLLTYFEMH